MSELNPNQATASSSDIYILNGKGEASIYEREGVEQLLEQGSLDPRVLAWRQGEKQWRPVCELVHKNEPEKKIRETKAIVSSVSSARMHSPIAERVRPEIPEKSAINSVGEFGRKSTAIVERQSTFKVMTSLSKEVRDLPEFQTQRPKKLGAFMGFLKRIGFAVRLMFSEKELIVFALLQWSVIGGAYFLWIQIFEWIPAESWEAIGEDDGDSSTEIIFALWSVLCVGLAAFPLGILSGCMGAVHFLNRRGEESTIAQCLKIVMPRAFQLWVFHWIDGLYTCKQILERLPKSKDDNSPRESRLLSEALYYAWKIGTCGITPSLVLGNGLVGACKDSIELLRRKFADVAMLRVGYSAVSWMIGIASYIGTIVLFAKTGFFEKSQSYAENVLMLKLFLWAGIPLLIAIGIIQVFVRPIFIVSLCDIYCDFLEDKNESIEVSPAPSKGTSAVVAFAVLVIISIGAIPFIISFLN